MQTVKRLYNQFQPNNYNLSISLDSIDHKFSGTVDIDGVSSVDSSVIRLHSKELVIDYVNVNGRQASHELDPENDELIITPSDTWGAEVLITIGFSGLITRTMHGVYSSQYVRDGKKKELIATQFESHHAREVFPCIDEPEAKATYDVTLTTALDQTVLSNMPALSQSEENDRLVTKFEQSPRMSTYLLAFVVGDLHKKTAYTSQGVEVNVWATPVQSPDSLDFALDHAVKTIEFFDDYFDIPYPLPKSDHVALPDFTSGAMENWGLITYRETTLLADPKTTTIASKQSIAIVISHELSHMWFGNLVTMKWWNDLWLNESFATMMEYVVVDSIHPEWNIWLDFAATESVMALRRDAMDGVQPVRVDVNHPAEISSLFDGAIVYAKGARLLKMLMSYIGEESFQNALRAYFKKHAYKNTEASDLWDELSKASGKDIASFMNPWLTRPGYPVVTVSSDSISQKRFFIGPHIKDDMIWPVPIGLPGKDGLLLDKESSQETVPIRSYLNHDNSGHFITNYDEGHFASLLEKIKSKDLPPIIRLSLPNEQLLLARAGNVSSSRLVPLLEYYENEDNDVVWDSIARIIGELKQFVEHDNEAESSLKKLSYLVAESLYKRLGWHARVGEPESDKKLRDTILSLVAYSDDSDVLAEIDKIYASTSIESLDPEIRPLIIGGIVKRSKGTELVESLFSLHNETHSADLQQDIQAGITMARQPEQIKYTLSKFTNTSTIRPQDVAHWFVYMLRNRYARNEAWQWLRDNWPWIDEQFSGDKSYDYFPRYAASGLTSRAQLDEYTTFFEPLRSEPSLTRTIDIGRKEIQARIELLERDQVAVCQALRNL